MSDKAISLSDAIADAVAKKRASSVSLDDAIADALAKKRGDIGTSPESPAFFTPYPINEEGQRIDASGKVVEPGFLDKIVAVGRGENPVATLAIDLLPLMNPAAWRAAKAGASKVDTAVREASPLTKGGVTYAALKAANHYTGMLPEPLPTIGSILASQVGPKGAMPAAADMAAREGIQPFRVPQQAAQESPLELTRRLRAEWRAANPNASLIPPAQAPEAVVSEVKSVAQKLKLSAEEFAAAKKMVQSGKTGDEVKDIILKLREMRVKFGLPTDATVRDLVEKANETGRMVR